MLFAKSVLGHDLWSTQRAIMRAVDRPRARVAVKACHASSKTYTAAEITIHALVKYRPVTVVTTAPTWHQVETLLWGEIHKALNLAPVKLPDLLAALNTTDIIIEKGVRFAEGISTTEAVRFQGYHAGEGGIVLIILDEAPGVRAEIFEAIDGIRAGGDVRVLMIGNPTIASGPFYDAFTSNRESWQTFTIGAFDTPNLAGLTLDNVLAMTPTELAHNERPYLISRQWVREMYDEWGPGHPLWQARVMGQFPDQAEDALYSLSWLEAARLRPAVTGNGRCHAGLDVAGPGEDETSLWVREGSSILLAQHWSQADPRGEVTAALTPYLNRLDAVNVDATGIGHYMAAHLKDQGFPVRDVNVGESARDPEKFANLKAELYWSARERLSQGDVNGLVDDRALAQLAGIRYSHNSRGQVAIEKKEDARKRGAKSPDRAEGFILCFAPGAVKKVPRAKIGQPYQRFGGIVSA